MPKVFLNITDIPSNNWSKRRRAAALAFGAEAIWDIAIPEQDELNENAIDVAGEILFEVLSNLNQVIDVVAADVQCYPVANYIIIDDLLKHGITVVVPSFMPYFYIDECIGELVKEMQFVKYTEYVTSDDI